MIRLNQRSMMLDTVNKTISRIAVASSGTDGYPLVEALTIQSTYGCQKAVDCVSVDVASSSIGRNALFVLFVPFIQL